MPRIGPPASGYERLAQQADLSDSDDDESSALVVHSVASIHSTQRSSAHPYSPPTGRHHMRRTKSSSSAVDIKVINARLERWADQIANKFKFKKDRSQHDHPPLEILHSVFVAPEGFRFDGVAATANTTTGDSLECPAAIEESQLVEEQFDQVVDDVRTAISKGIDPKLIKQGSSGSYFMRDCDGKIVAVFKPKDEEPYELLRRAFVLLCLQFMTTSS
jgi:phosphatidylinositol 4-kinase type 2